MKPGFTGRGGKNKKKATDPLLWLPLWWASVGKRSQKTRRHQTAATTGLNLARAARGTRDARETRAPTSGAVLDTQGISCHTHSLAAAACIFFSQQLNRRSGICAIVLRVETDKNSRLPYLASVIVIIVGYCYYCCCFYPSRSLSSIIIIIMNILGA